MRSNPRFIRRAAVALVAAAAFGLSGASLAGAQTPSSAPSEGTGDVKSVAVQPADAKPDDPNGGQWFVIELAPGRRGTLRAKVANPADVAQRVTFSVQDLVFAEDGTPTLNDGPRQEDVGAWGVLPTRTLDIGPGQTFTVPFQIKVPADADPGDHVGVFVATTTNLQGQFKVSRRIATRLYVTVPGDATKAYEIASVSPARDSLFFPGSITTKVRLRNTGRVRLAPIVAVRGTRATGPQVLLSQSNEEYVARVDVPWYGGIVKLPVRVETEEGLVRTADRTVVVVPWGLLASVLVGGVLLWLALRWWRNRTSKVADLRADIERLERMVTRPETTSPAPAPDVDDPAADEHDAEIDALLAGLKRAQRTGSAASLARLALSLHELGGDAASWLVAALRTGDSQYRAEVVSTLASMEPAAVSAALGRSAADKALLAEIEAARAPADVATRRPAAKKRVPRSPTDATPLPAPRAPRKSEPTAPKRRPPAG